MTKGSREYFLGIDVGSVSTNIVLMDESNKVVEEVNQRLLGEPLQILCRALREITEKHKRKNIVALSVTGSGGKVVSELIGGMFVNEVIAQSAATFHFHPEARTVIEIGGEDAKLIFLDPDPELPGEYKLEDFSMNSVCSAGTGSFLDQQAFRLQIGIEEFGKLALQSKNPPRIAGRCSVFAKSDMIHLQQVGTPHYEIVAGLCYALARNFISVLGAGKEIPRPISFQGGVAANAGIREAFRDLLGLKTGELIIPKRFMAMGAIGAVLHSRKKSAERAPFQGLEGLEKHLERLEREGEVALREPLTRPQLPRSEVVTQLDLKEGEKVRVYLGIDIGSVSTNLVLIDEQKRVLAKRYLRTQSKPLQVVQVGLQEIYDEIGDKVEIAGVGTTGSGRYLIGDFVGADVIRNEISAQAAASIDIDPTVDTIFEIGGQDSKYISVDNGVVVDFNMNHACAAGTGSFLEEQAEQLGVDIKGEFAELAFQSKRPVPLAEKCTVFMESDLVHYQQKGAGKEDLMAGLSYSIVQNYLNKVVKTGRIGKNIFFQGGTAFNQATVAAFEKVTGKRITVPPHHEVTGAIGVALLAREAASEGVPSRFKGFDLSKKSYTFESFPCEDCPNLCEINKITVEGDAPLYYGSRCGKYDVDKKKKLDKGIPDLFDERERWLLNVYPDRQPADPGAPVVGLPRALMLFELMPLFKAFFSELGFRVVISDRTNETIAKKSTEVVSAEFCFPVKVAHGHVLNLIEKGVDIIFFPALQEMKNTDSTQEHAWLCPWNQGIPFTVLSAIDVTKYGTRMIHPDIWFSAPEPMVARRFAEIGQEFGKGWKESLQAYYVAKAYQNKFYDRVKKRGKEILESLPQDGMAMVILSRSYNGCDQRLNLNIPKKLRQMGVLPIPMDFLPLDEMALTKTDERINWKNGQRFVKAARIIRDDPRLHAMYITNFNCGPDAFIRYYLQDNLKGKPCFELEVDEHSSDTGAITRCEAYLDSLNNRRKHKIRAEFPEPVRRPYTRDMTIYLPQPDCLNALPTLWQAAFAAQGLEIQLFPRSNHQTLEYARQFSTSKECYPYQLVLGDMVRILKDESIDKERLAFMVPVTPGACRLLGYPKGQRMVLDHLGYERVPLINPTTRWKEGKDLIGRSYMHVERLLYLANTANELLLKRAREIRPYERNRGETQEVYAGFFQELVQATRSGKGFEPLLRRAAKRFARIPTAGEGTKPIIGILGEIYVRMTPFANGFLEDEIERLGGEAWIVPLSELMFFRNQWFIDYSLRTFKPAEALSWLVTDKAMRWYAHRYERPFRGSMKNAFDSIETQETMALADPFVYRGMWGETVPNIGRMVELIDHNMVQGIMNVGPFACMPTTLGNALAKRVLQAKGTFPFMTMSCEGLEKTNAITRIEAFMFQAQQYMRERGAAKTPVQKAV